eukprot:757470-Prorocentrum_minimum.AAC.2
MALEETNSFKNATYEGEELPPTFLRDAESENRELGEVKTRRENSRRSFRESIVKSVNPANVKAKVTHTAKHRKRFVFVAFVGFIAAIAATLVSWKITNDAGENALIDLGKTYQKDAIVNFRQSMDQQTMSTVYIEPYFGDGVVHPPLPQPRARVPRDGRAGRHRAQVRRVLLPAAEVPRQLALPLRPRRGLLRGSALLQASVPIRVEEEGDPRLAGVVYKLQQGTRPRTGQLGGPASRGLVPINTTRRRIPRPLGRVGAVHAPR